MLGLMQIIKKEFEFNGSTFVVDVREPRKYGIKARAFVFLPDSFIGGRLETRRQERVLFSAAMDALGGSSEGWGYSQKAGCTCPCSPGFVSKEGERNVEIFVSEKKGK